MSGGRFPLLLMAAVWVNGVAWSQEAPPVRSNSETNSPAPGANSTGTATNTVPNVEGQDFTNSPTNLSTIATNVVPQVVGPELKPVEVVPEKPKDSETRKAEAEEAKIRALGEFGVIPRRDPFRLEPPSPKIEEPKIEEFVPVGAPHLQGISTLYNPPKAVLRMSKAGGGKARSVFLGPEESKDGVEVLSVDVASSTVVVKVGEHTYDLTIEKPKFASKPSLGSGSRGSSRKPSTSGRTTRPSNRPGSTGSRPSTPPRKPGGLKPVPTRPDASFRASPPQYELPAFNEAVQKLAVEPSQISTQRELIHGQLNYTVPTDFPEKLR